MSAVDFEVKLNRSFWRWIQGDGDLFTFASSRPLNDPLPAIVTDLVLCSFSSCNSDW
jgi:hypothetical protein